MAIILTEAEALDALRAAVRAHGTAKSWAESHNISRQHVSDCLRCKRDIGDLVAGALKLRVLQQPKVFVSVE